ncbi:MAG: FxLYD domain-containing protein [Bryobacteraceae bacterium]
MGRIFAVAFLVAAFTMAGAADKKPNKKAKGAPDLAITSLKIEREDKVVSIEGVVKNISGKPIRGVILFFEFLEFNGRMISRMKTEATEHVLEDGEEVEFLAQTPDQVRAVDIRVDAEDKSARYLIPDKPGPHRIE